MSTTGHPTAPGRLANDYVLELRDIAKDFGGVQALDGVNIAVKPGEILCLVGENGAGKSTLAAVAAGTVAPDRGSIWFDGRSLELRNPADAEAAGIHLAPQELLLCPALTVAENVMMGDLPRNRAGVMSRRRMRTEARGRLSRLGLGELDVDHCVEGLSVVQQALIQIARAMRPGARVLILDEPTAPMTAPETDRLLAVLRTITASGVAIIYVSHRLDEIFQVADRVAVLRNGRNASTFSARDLDYSALVSAMVGGKNLDQEMPAHRHRGPTALSVRDLCSSTLAMVSFDVHKGEVLGVYGIAGSGRDHIGPATFGAAARKYGVVRTCDGLVRNHRNNPRAAIAAGMGYVPAERRAQGLALGMSIRENLTMAILPALSPHGVIRRKAERLLTEKWIEKLQLATPSTETPVGLLSGGTQQKVLLARWLVANTNVLILDEPTRGVDVGTKVEIYRLLRQLADSGTAILVISSEVAVVAAVCDRVLVLKGGRVVAECSEPTQQQILEAAIDPEAVTAQ